MLCTPRLFQSPHTNLPRIIRGGPRHHKHHNRYEKSIIPPSRGVDDFKLPLCIRRWISSKLLYFRRTLPWEYISLALFKFVAPLLILSLVPVTAQEFSPAAIPHLTIQGDNTSICADTFTSPIGIEGTNLTLGTQEDKLSWVTQSAGTEQLFIFSHLAGIFASSVYFHDVIPLKILISDITVLFLVLGFLKSLQILGIGIWALESALIVRSCCSQLTVTRKSSSGLEPTLLTLANLLLFLFHQQQQQQKQKQQKQKQQKQKQKQQQQKVKLLN